MYGSFEANQLARAAVGISPPVVNRVSPGVTSFVAAALSHRGTYIAVSSAYGFILGIGSRRKNDTEASLPGKRK